MQIRPYIGSKVTSDSLTTENGRITMLPDGKVKVHLTNVATSCYRFDEGVYDLEVVSSDGTVTRVLEGRVIVRKEVTHD